MAKGYPAPRHRQTKHHWHGSIRRAIEGFLYQLGVLYALEKAFTGKKITDIDIYSGISSGSIASALVATDVDIEEVIRSIQGGSTVMPRLKASVLFDLNTKGIMKRAGFRLLIIYVHRQVNG